MWWLWIVGPLAVIAIYLLTAQTDHDRVAHEIMLWRNALGRRLAASRKKKGQKADKPAPAAYRGGSDKKAAAAKEPAGKQDKNAASAKQKSALHPLAPPQSRSLSTELMRMLERTGGGTVFGHYELVPRLAYLSVLTAMSTASSDQQTVVAKLVKPGPLFTVRPLPIVDGKRVENTGVKFGKDPEFMAEFLVEGANPKAIGKWLIRPLREALRELPDAWLFVEGKVMALTLYGRAEAGRMEALVATADEIFAEHGAKGGPSLFGIDDDDEDDDEDAAGEEEQDASAEDDDEGDEEEEGEEGDKAAGGAGEDRAASK